MKFYSVKYCLTTGIEEFAGELTECGQYAHNKPRGYRFERIGKDAFTSRADAVAAARKKREKAIVSTRKRLMRLESMDFVA